jgi:hypothetical protein
MSKSLKMNPQLRNRMAFEIVHLMHLKHDLCPFYNTPLTRSKQVASTNQQSSFCICISGLVSQLYVERERERERGDAGEVTPCLSANR